MGKITSPRGIKGEIKIKVYNETTTMFTEGRSVWIETSEGAFLNKIIQYFNNGNKIPFLKFVDFDSIDQVEQFRGCKLYIPRSEFDPLLEGEHYLYDLVGFRVINEKKVELGVVKDTLSLSSSNMLVLDINGKEILIPIVGEFVKLFDYENKTLYVQEVEGLLKL